LITILLTATCDDYAIIGPPTLSTTRWTTGRSFNATVLRRTFGNFSLFFEANSRSRGIVRWTPWRGSPSAHAPNIYDSPCSTSA